MTLPSPLLLWTAALVLGAGVAAGVWRWRMRARGMDPEPLPQAWPLQSRPVFSPDEQAVYRQLVEVFPHHAVLVKLPLVRFCQPEEPAEVRQWYRLIGSMSVTFALASPSGRVVAAIDLEGARAPSPRSLKVKQEVLAACRVRYLRCQAQRLPTPAELQLLVPQGAAGMRGPQAAPSARRTAPPESADAARRGRKPLWRDPGFMQDSHHGRQAGSATTPSSMLPLMGDEPSLQRGRQAKVDLSQDLAEALGDGGPPPPMSARH